MAMDENKVQYLEQIIAALTDDIANLSRIVTDGNGTPPLTARVFAAERDVKRIEKDIAKILLTLEKIKILELDMRTHITDYSRFLEEYNKKLSREEQLTDSYQLQRRDQKFFGAKEDRKYKWGVASWIVQTIVTIVVSFGAAYAAVQWS